MMVNYWKSTGTPAVSGDSAFRDRWAGEITPPAQDDGRTLAPLTQQSPSAQQTSMAQQTPATTQQAPMAQQAPVTTQQAPMIQQTPTTVQQAPMTQQPPMRGSIQTTPVADSQQMGMGSMLPVPGATLHMRNGLPSEVIESPTTTDEAYMGSLKALLNRNKGNYVVAAFLIGTQGETTWEGILYDVGNDYVTIYQEGRDRYIVCDIYSLKYLEFYDMRRRELCNQILQEMETQ